MVAFGRVVVDDVEDDLDARVVHRLHHLLELLDLLAEVAARAVLAVRREVADRVVAPVVAQPHLHEPVVVDELVHRHQLDGGDAEPDEPVDDVREREARVGAAEVRRHRRVRLRESLGVDFVEQRLVQRCHRRAVVAPVEVRIDDDRLRHEARAVARAGPALVTEAIRVDGLTPADRTGDGLAVRIEQQLLVVAAQALLRRPLAVDAVAVALTRADAGEEHVMDERGLLAHRDARLVPGRVEETHVDLGRGLAEQREVRAGSVPCGTERERCAREHREVRHARRRVLRARDARVRTSAPARRSGRGSFASGGAAIEAR